MTNDLTPDLADLLTLTGRLLVTDDLTPDLMTWRQASQVPAYRLLPGMTGVACMAAWSVATVTVTRADVAVTWQAADGAMAVETYDLTDLVSIYPASLPAWSDPM